MKIRIGVGLGGAGVPDGFATAVDHLERLGADSLWLSEVVSSAIVDPFVGMAHALSRTEALKVGTGVAVLPGRHPVLVAKQLASLAGLAPGRVLPVFGLQPARPRERGFFPVPAARRGAVFDESLELLRLLLSRDRVTYHGEFFTVEDVGVAPLPRKPMDVWVGGAGPAALRRAGRFGDGWLGSFLTPEEAGAARETIQSAAAAAGREVDPDHFGVSFPVAVDGVGDDLLALVRHRRPDVEANRLVAEGWAGACRLVERYVEVGMSKFVVRPADSAPSLDRFLDGFARELMPLQT